MTLTAALLDPYLGGSAAARPLITYYDDATGERVELSGTTTANWAAKAANLLRDECDVEPGTPRRGAAARALADGGGAAGGVVVRRGGRRRPRGGGLGAVRRRPGRSRAGGGARRRGGGALARRVRQGHAGLPAGVVDFAPEVRLHGDDFVPGSRFPARRRRSRARRWRRSWPTPAARAAALGVGADDRVLSTLEWSTVDGVTDGLLAVLVAGASLVQCRNADPAALDRRAAAEKVTIRLG